MRILIAGDFCPKYELKNFLTSDSSNLVFAGVKEWITKADYSILNLECPIVKSKAKPIEKEGPNLYCSEDAFLPVVEAGFKCVTLANNHFRDYGNDGCSDTISSLDTHNIDHIGGGKNLEEASRILYKQINCCNIAFINCCEHEFSIADSNNAGSCPMDLVDIPRKILEAKGKADYVIVITHGGNELYDYPSPRMQKTYRWFIELGADAVVNHHQHCISGYEVYDGKPIFYGLGNFCFDTISKCPSKWNEGYMVLLTLDENKAKDPAFECIPYRQCQNNYLVCKPSPKELEAFEQKLARINHIISNPQKLEMQYSEFMRSEYKNKSISLMPYSNKYLRYACKKGLLPSFITKQRKRLILAHTQCESLRDVFLYYLKH